MEYQSQADGNPFNGNLMHIFEWPNQPFSAIPLENRLKQNKQRRLALEKEKQKERQEILEKRKCKEDNVQKILRQKHQARQNAKLVFGNMQKTFTDKFGDQYWRKAQDIQEKIQQCRTRADQYRTLYQKRIHEVREDRERNVRFRKNVKNKQEQDRSLNYHLAEWRSYEKKIAEKYRGENKSPNRMYLKVARRQEELKQLICKHRQEVQGENSRAWGQKMEYKNIRLVREQNGPEQEDCNSQKSNPIYSTHDISVFGLSKSFQNPLRMLRSMGQFLQNNTLAVDLTRDGELIAKFERYLKQEGRAHAGGQYQKNH